MRALIAVPAYPELARGRIERFYDDAVVVPVRYVRALRCAGGLEAILLPTPLDEVEAGEILERYDGLLLLGGGDLEPSTYGRDPTTRIYGVSSDRDANELALTRAALARGLPVLAICRGQQVLNVALGGSLDQHISDRLEGHGIPGVEDGAQLHDVAIEPGTRLADAIATEDARVSSHHHQAVDHVGTGLVVAARTPDGVIEAIELADPAAPWVVGVQWHPEDTAADDPAQQRLFDAFVDHAAKGR